MTARKSLNVLDRTFLAAEKREVMMHVGALMPFSAPPAGAPHFARELLDALRRDVAVQSPWNLKLRHPDHLTSPLQAWVEDEAFELDYHVRRSALAWPGDERELVLVSRLHSVPIDFHRPPWEAHFIEGLEGGRVAIYFKVHHALVDGFTGMRLLARSLSTDASDHDAPMFFARPPLERATRKRELPQAGDPELEEPPAYELLMRSVRDQLGAAKDVGRALMTMMRASRERDRRLVLPLQAPRSVLNRRVSRSRRFATRQVALSRLKAIAVAHRGTLNDVVLAICASALRRFLREQNALPAEPLVAMVPVNLRSKDDPGGGNAVSAILVSLATDVDDPAARLGAIIESSARAKEQLRGMSTSAILQYGVVLMAPLLLSFVPAAVERMRPAFNVVVSNVPGPETPLHFLGRRLEAFYPISIPFHGYALNITVQSYAGTMNFGYVGCRETVPHLQRLAVYSGQAVDELEAAPGGAERRV